ncbi:MAG: helix-turn-helix domain-containing protein [Candidatus Nitrosotenuis sp.]
MFVLNGNADRIVKTLKSCGLTEYESKVYFTLLLTERSKMGELSKKSSVPQSKIYWTIESLRDKGLVDVDEEMPKTAIPRKFEPYLSKAINEKQREISNLIESGNSIRDTIYGLRSVAVKYRNKYRVFEPKHRRKRLF